MRARNYRKYIVAALAGIAIHWLILYLGYAAPRIAQGVAPTGFFRAYFSHMAQAGDVPHYVEIASGGYQSAGEHANNIVFYPLFPLLMWLAHWVIPDYVAAGTVISNLCLGAATAGMLALMETELGEKRAMRGALLFSLFPFGFFMVGAYTESLFIMLLTLDMLALAKRRWLWVGALGCLAALTRTQGLALLVPAVYELCLDLRQKRAPKSALWVLLIPLGTGLYLLLNRVVCGSATAFLGYQAAAPWYNTSHWIAENLAQHYGMALNHPGLAVIIYWVQLLLYFAALGLLLWGLKAGLRPSFVALGGAYLFMTYLHGWMISGPRYVMACVPLYLALAKTGREDGALPVAIPMGALAVVYALWYLQGQAIM